MYLAKTPRIIKPLYRNFVWSIPTSEKVIYLTFDDGPTPEITPWALDTLEQYNAKATFFCVGANAAKHLGILKQIIGKGHATGNHSHNHLNGRKTPDEDFFEDIEKCAALIDSKLFRPPYGKLSKSQSTRLKQQYSIIMWDVLSGDFDCSISKEKCLRNVINNAKEGSIVVFHDSEKAKERLCYSLPNTLEHFTEKGFRFEAIDEKRLALPSS